jgi:hypothetical protein
VSAAATLPVLPTGIGEGDPCPACVAAGLVDPTTTYSTGTADDPARYLMATKHGQPLAMCDTCGAEYRTVGQPKHEHADEYTGPPEVVTLSDGRQGVAPAWMADVLRCAGMAT